MTLKRFLRFAGWLGCVAVAVTILNGCASAEPDNDMARPWNQPKGWETGLPPGAMQGR